jgi:DNA primase
MEIAMSYVDFDNVRKHVSVEQAAAWLGLELKKANHQLRGHCPIHGGGPRCFVVTPAENVFYCFAPECRAGGGVIELVMKVRGLQERDAALALQEHFLGRNANVVSIDSPPSRIDYLQPEHPDVQALGIPVEVAKMLGIGYAPRGTMAKRVLLPIRNKSGKLVGYVGLALDNEQPIKLPSRWHL